MSLAELDLGVVMLRPDGHELRFERRIDRPLEKVWAALTVPERIADWLAEADVDLRVGGRFRLRFTEPTYAFEGEIVALDPPRLFAWTWPHEQHPHSVVTWALFPDGDGCRLVLTQTAMHPPHLVEVAAGWHALLECLPGAAGGARVVWTNERELALRKLYAARLAG